MNVKYKIYGKDLLHNLLNNQLNNKWMRSIIDLFQKLQIMYKEEMKLKLAELFLKLFLNL